MGRTILAVVSLATGIAAQQSTSLSVADLVVSSRHQHLHPSQRFVSRDWSPTDSDDRPRLRLANIGPLLLDAGVFAEGYGNPDVVAGLLTQSGLREALAALGVDVESIRFEGPPHRLQIAADYPEQVTAALARLREQIVRPVDIHLRLERITDGSTVVLLEGRRRTVDGRAFVLGDVVAQPALIDASVEIAAGSSIGDPTPATITHGCTAAVRVRPLPFQDGLLAEVVLRHGELQPITDVDPTASLGPLQRVTVDFDECGLVFRPGTSASPSVHHWVDQEGRTLRLTVACDVPPVPAPRGDARIAATSLLASPIRGFAALIGDPEDPFHHVEFATWLESLERRDRDGVFHFETGDGPGASIVLRGPNAERLARTIASGFDAQLRPVTIDVEVLDVPAGMTPGRGDALPAAVRRIAGLRGPVLADLPVAVSAQRQSTFILDVESEVAQGARVLDPLVDTFEVGPFLTLRTRTGASGVDAVDLHLDLSRLLGVDAIGIRVANPTQGIYAESGNPLLLPAESAVIDAPRVASMGVRETVYLDGDGRAEVRQSAVQVLGQGRELLIRLSATP